MTFDHSPGFYALVGPNAAGKTHYLRSLFGPGVAFVPAGADALFAGRTVGQHLAWAGAAKPLGHVHNLVEPKTRITDLSVGQRRELSINIALATDEPLLLLDEPFDGLDVDTRTRVRDRIINYLATDPERTVIMASHRAEDLAGLADHVIRVFDHDVSAPLVLDDARDAFPLLSGKKESVDKLVNGRRVLSREELGPQVRVQLAEPVTNVSGVEISYPDDQQLIELLASRKV